MSEFSVSGEGERDAVLDAENPPPFDVKRGVGAVGQHLPEGDFRQHLIGRQTRVLA